MPVRTLLFLFSLIPFCNLAVEKGTSAEDPKPVAVDFASQVWPIFQAHCLDCHGPDTQESHFRVDSLRSFRLGGGSGEPAINPDNPNKSHLLSLVTHQDDEQRMPPSDAPRLTDEQIEILRRWIQAGAKWDDAVPSADDQISGSDHWSFTPLQAHAIPTLDSAWIRQPLDAWVYQKLQQHELTPSGEASRRTLIRRLYLDLLGLPPSPEQVAQFVEDPSPHAYEQLVEQLLADPHAGERWARYWLDLVRFAETDGFETNRERPNAWPFRDYVIDALNSDKPYNQFVMEQIAGDALGEPVATAYLVAGTRDIVKSPDVNLTMMQRQNELDDMINTTGTTFLGVTLGCARCHNHKFDAITQRDYYAVQAIFSGTQHGERALPPSISQQHRSAELLKQVSELRQQLASFTKTKLNLRPSVNAKENVDSFEPTLASRIRFSIFATNSSEPCIDELEVYAQGVNVALASLGARPSSSSNLPGYEIHQLKHVNDGVSGNSRSWISNENGKGWVQIDFAQPVTIDSVRWARDRQGQFADRLATHYQIESSLGEEPWQLLASSQDRVPFEAQNNQPLAEQLAAQYDFSALPMESRKSLQQSLDKLLVLETEYRAQASSLNAYVGNFEQPGTTYRLFRGEPQQPRELVAPNTIEALGELAIDANTGEQQRRLALAEWIVQPNNPLTARVIVNRIWQHHFGKGIVATPNDFGVAGVVPTHPELLDYLADQLLRHDWSLKQLHRTILLSATYRQSSRPNPKAMKVDGATRLLWRFPPRRLDAEALRDSILAVSGSLDLRMGGPGFSAFEVELENVRHYFPKSNYGPADWRRMIYMTKVRQEQDAVFGIFDCPDGSTGVPARNRSTTPLQSLNLFNSQFTLQQASFLAARTEADYPADVPGQINAAYQYCFGRSPSQDESLDAQEFISAQGLVPFCRAMLNSNEFLFLP
jgi:mono/diheme cytochrome c family protein